MFACGLLLLASGAATRAADWRKIAEGRTGVRTAPGFVWAGDKQRAFLVGGQTADGTACVMAFDPAADAWEAVSESKPAVPRGENFNIASRVAYAPAAQAIFVLSWDADLGHFGELHRFDLGTGQWRNLGTDPALDDLTFCSLICDAQRNRLVVVGSDKREGNIGWSRTLLFDVAAEKWSELPLPAREIVEQHKRRTALHEGLSDLIGRTRLAWYRDPQGSGTEAERNALLDASATLAEAGDLGPWKAELEAYRAQVAARELLPGLKRLHAVRRRFEDAIDAAYPVPKSRRNSPLAHDAANDCAVLFGGDHLDYLMNDTWILDLAKNAWRRAEPQSAPAPRAGHAFAYLPKSGKLAMYEGYLEGHTWGAVDRGPQAVWLFHANTERWELAHARPWTRELPPLGAFYGYAQQHYVVPPLVADERDRLVLVVPGTSGGDARPSSTWKLELDDAPVPRETVESLSSRPNVRRERTGPYVAAFNEVADPPRPADLASLPANRWVKFPDPPRNSMKERPRAWNTVVWDARREQILSWGGGHSVPSANSVAHFSPVSNRMVESYDAEVPDRGVGMGYGAHGSTLLARPWIPAHTYRLYAWEPHSGLMLFAYRQGGQGSRMHFYDPARMDWLRTTRTVPYDANYTRTLSITTPHGVAVWTTTNNEPGLWMVDLSQGIDGMEVRRIEVTGGKLPANSVDRDGMAYDSKRNRLLLHCIGDEKNPRDDRLLAVGLDDGRLEPLASPPPDIAAMLCVREMTHVGHADWVIYNQAFDVRFEDRGPGSIFRVYDCANDRWRLFDAGPGPTGMPVLQGWFYEPRRQLVFAMNQSGEVWTLRIDPLTAKLRDRPPAATN